MGPGLSSPRRAASRPLRAGILDSGASEALGGPPDSTFVRKKLTSATDRSGFGSFVAPLLQPTTPPTAPPPLSPPPRALLPSPSLPVQSPALDGRLSPAPQPHLRPPPSPSSPPCSSAVPEPMDAEAAVTPSPAPPPSPMEIVAPPPHPSIHSGGARP
ncbi:uncharacterized protein LOC126278897 [Schistocerca gregaria]|uniref:uncharacterized protein LOC126278897 n=1 Tax=Schistocerca gregaria TaxID=7010 RepID=UPI00211E62A8|nr:uncharacterized protein LOC126278897 [Schistocerca gregaria]